VVLKPCVSVSVSEPLQIQARSLLHSAQNMYTNTCLDLCDPKGSLPGGTC